MNDFDLIIVGAGPSGSNAAAVALDAGLRVVQIDAARFPRVKPCAGGVTLKAATALRHSLDRSVCRSFDAIEFNLWGKRRNRFSHSGVVLRTVCRHIEVVDAKEGEEPTGGVKSRATCKVLRCNVLFRARCEVPRARLRAGHAAREHVARESTLHRSTLHVARDSALPQRHRSTDSGGPTRRQIDRAGRRGG